MTLREKQSIFVLQISRLVAFAYSQGFEFTFGEALRSPEEAIRLEHEGKGIANSLHIISLAIDFNLFKDGKYLKDTESYTSLGEWWEKQSTTFYTCCWGGRFKDGNHFSIEYGGIK